MGRGGLKCKIQGESLPQTEKQNPTHSFKNKSKRVKLKIHSCAVLCLIAQSCPTLCDPMDCSLPGSSVHGDSPGKNTGVGCHALLQGIFPVRGSNPGCPHFRQILYHLNHQGRPRSTAYGSYTLPRGLLDSKMYPLFTFSGTWK